tara:strand:- start:2782 stop:3741 length:960 start_codon:yes stop_codon:yes gene_type:complete
MNLNNNLISLSGDASFRRFYRNKNKKNSIIVFANKEKKNNLLVYDAVNKILKKNNIKAPKLIKEHYKENFIEIEDLGNKTIYDVLKNNKNKISYYYKILIILKKLQKIKDKKVKTFNKKNYFVPKYTKKKLFEEAKLFLDWYIPKKVSKKKQILLKKKLKNIILNLINNLQIKNKIFVHRDFHISNMMLYKKNIYLLDSQDAVYGNIAYDLASLIDDVRFKTTLEEKKKIFKKYISINKLFETTKLQNDFEILSVLRNIKIIGIFTRLSIRDKKKKYLKLIPRAWNLIELRIDKNNKFKELKYILDKFFPKKIRNKYEN